jgi:hypothetical protein
MIRSSIFLSLAAGLLTSLAFGTPNQASSPLPLVTVQSILDPLASGDTNSSVDVTFNEASTDPQSIVPQAGCTITRSGTTRISNSTVTEPASMSLLGIGMAGFFTYRRLFKRPAAA